MDLLIRESRGPGWIIAEPRARIRHGKPAIQAVRARYHRLPEDVLRIVRLFLVGDDTDASDNGTHASTAQARDEMTQLSLLAHEAESEDLKPQTGAVLRLLHERGSLTQREAAQLIGCWRLGARIMELRDAGHEITTVWEANGNGGRHGRYVLGSRGDAA